MSTQSGIIVEGPGKPFTIVDNLLRPSPGPGQVLVKCLGVAINPIDSIQQQSGLLVKEWPAVLGSDFAGVVIDVGPDCKKLRRGDHIFGCAPVGQNKFTPFQETFLAQEDVVLKKVDNISIEEASATGCGLLTAGLSILAGTKLELPRDGRKAPEKDEWIVILGGSGTVGQFAVQIAYICGYKVVASCSPSNRSVAIQAGAKETFNNRASIDEQLKEIKKLTSGNFARIFDATTYGYELMLKALETCSTATTKYLSSVDTWSEFKTPPSIKEYRTSTGFLCRLDEPLGREVTRDIASWISAFETHLAAGTLRPVALQIDDRIGWDRVIQGVKDLQDGKASKKIVARTQNE